MGIIHFALILPFLMVGIDATPSSQDNRQRNGGYECSNAVVNRRGWDLYFTCCRNIFADKNPCPIACPCQHNARCEPEKRLCVCPAGWTGRFCQDECIEGKYGINCSHRCNCGDGARCDRFTGNCICKHPDCFDRCPSGFYGADCSEKCVCDDSGCHQILGKCICENGGTIVRVNQSEICLCSPGWQAGKCDEKCSNGFYGDGCRHICGACGENSTCNHVTGHCTCINNERCSGSLCKPGFIGIRCLKRCRCSHSTACTTQDGNCGCVKDQMCIPETQTEKDSQTETSTLLAASLPAAMFVICAVMALAAKIMCTRCRSSSKTRTRTDTYVNVKESEEKCSEKDETFVRPSSQYFTNKTYNSVIDILPKGMTVMHLVYDDANNPSVSHTYPRIPKEKHHIAKMCLGDTAGSPASLPTPLDVSGEYQEYKQDESQPEYMGLMKNAMWNFFRQSNETEDIYQEAFDCPGREIPRINIQNCDSVPAENIHVLQAEMHHNKTSTNTKDSSSSLNDLSSIYSNIIICPMSINEFEESFKKDRSDSTEESSLLNQDTKNSIYPNLKYNLQNSSIIGSYEVHKGSSEHVSEEMTDVIDHVLHFNGKNNKDEVRTRPRSVRRQIKSCGSEYIEAINPIYAELQFSQPEIEQESTSIEPGKLKAFEHLFADDLYANLEMLSDCESFEEGVLYRKVEKEKKNQNPQGSPTISLQTKDRVGVYTTFDKKTKCGKLKPNKWVVDKGKTVDFRISPSSPSMLLKSYDGGKYNRKDCAKPLLSRSHSYGYDDTRTTTRQPSKH